MAEVNEPGGFIQSLREWPEKPEIVGLARFMAWPGGPATAETVGRIFEEIVGPLRRALPVDGVLLSLHGAMVAEDRPDVEGDLLESVRQTIGPTVPLVATLDLHANVTRKMVANADVLTLFHTAPHIDVLETGKRGARALHRLVTGERVHRAFQKLPFVVPAERANTQDPESVSYEFRRRLEALEAEATVLSAGLSTVQPWLDIPEMGSSVIVTATDPAKAERACRELADVVWQRRRDYLSELVDVADAVWRAHAIRDGLVVLGDGADATNSGGTGDGTVVLAELVKYDWPRTALVPLVSPDLVAEARRRGVGASWTRPVGAARGGRNGSPLSLTVRVESLFDARFVLSGHLGTNLPIDLAGGAVLACGDVRLVVSTRSGPHFAPQYFRSAGLDPFAVNVLVAKSPCGFRAAYQDRAALIMMVRLPGCAPSDFWNHPYHRIQHPLWPWDEIPTWQARPEIFGE
jgi:microcystin degradation protein MlrC